MNEAATKTIQTKIRRWRLALSLSQAELSHRAGLSTTSISLIENGEHAPHADTLHKLVVNGFGATLDEFLEHDPEVAPRKERATGMSMPNLRDWRVYRGLTVRQVADAVGVTTSTIGHVERGGNASPRLYNMLLHYLRLTPDDLEASPLAPLTLEERQAAPWPKPSMPQTLKDIQIEKDKRAKKRAKHAIDTMLHDNKRRVREEAPTPDTTKITIDENADPDLAKLVDSINFLKSEIRLHKGREFREDEAFRKKRFKE